MKIVSESTRGTAYTKIVSVKEVSHELSRTDGKIFTEEC